MKKQLFATTAFFALAASAVYADDPAPAVDATDQPARTHIDTTVVGDAVAEGANSSTPGLDNDHEFRPGAPELLSATKRLNLSPKQEAQVREAIERADAGAAVLIKHEKDLRQMVAATTPQDPLYSKLISDQAAGPARWSENREGLRQQVISILTPEQQVKFQAMQAQR